MALLESMAAFLNSVSQTKDGENGSQYLKQLESSYFAAMQAFQQEVHEVKKRQHRQVEEEVEQRVSVDATLQGASNTVISGTTLSFGRDPRHTTEGSPRVAKTRADTQGTSRCCVSSSADRSRCLCSLRDTF